jgi:hypothetical protein
MEYKLIDLKDFVLKIDRKFIRGYDVSKKETLSQTADIILDFINYRIQVGEINEDLEIITSYSEIAKKTGLVKTSKVSGREIRRVYGALDELLSTHYRYNELDEHDMLHMNRLDVLSNTGTKIDISKSEEFDHTEKRVIIKLDKTYVDVVKNIDDDNSILFQTLLELRTKPAKDLYKKIKAVELTDAVRFERTYLMKYFGGADWKQTYNTIGRAVKKINETEKAEFFISTKVKRNSDYVEFFVEQKDKAIEVDTTVVINDLSAPDEIKIKELQEQLDILLKKREEDSIDVYSEETLDGRETISYAPLKRIVENTIVTMDSDDIFASEADLMKQALSINLDIYLNRASVDEADEINTWKPRIERYIDETLAKKI